MKKATLLLVLFAVTSSSVFAQQVSNINFDLIEAQVTDTNAITYYPILIKRFRQGDATLTAKEYSLIYYGNVYSEHYDPYGSSDNELQMVELSNQGKFMDAIPYGEMVLEENPVNLQASFRLAVCYSRIGEEEKAKQYAQMYFPLLEAIYRSGDGKSIETAYVVVKVADEYAVLADSELERTSQTLVGETDVITVEAIDPKADAPDDAVYFNVSQPLKYMKQQLVGEE